MGRPHPILRRRPILLVLPGLAALSFSCASVDPPARTAELAGADPPARTAELVGSGRDHYVSAAAGPGGNGSRTAPWSLEEALSGGSGVKPGDTIWLQGGNYNGTFTCRLQGSATAPVTIRPLPGETAKLVKVDGAENTGVLTIRNSWVTVRDLEITNTFQNRNPLDSRGAAQPWRGSGVNLFAPNIRLLNLTIHDTGHGVGVWTPDGGVEIYGCVMFYCGNNKREHGVYAHNEVGTDTIRDNIFFASAGYGLHLYANHQGLGLEGFEVEGNIAFCNGALTAENQAADQILVGGVTGVPARRIVLRRNAVYAPLNVPPSKSRGIRLGYEDSGNEDVLLEENYAAARKPLAVRWWKSATIRRNTLVGDGNLVELLTPPGTPANHGVWKGNSYLRVPDGLPGFTLDESRSLTPEEWAQQTGPSGGGSPSSSEQSASSGVWVLVRPNRYEPGRANVAVFNWKGQEQVPVDLKEVLRKGDRFEVRDAQNFLGEPVLTGVFDEQPVKLPMRLQTIAKPVGNVERSPSHTSAEFCAFVVRRISTQAGPGQVPSSTRPGPR